jgi:hypothetical protein
VAFTDEDGADVVPTSIKWSLVTQGNVVVNSLDQVEVTVPAASITIVLSGDDLQILSGEESDAYAYRYFVVESTYNSSLGVALPSKGELLFSVKNLHYVGVTYA